MAIHIERGELPHHFQITIDREGFRKWVKAILLQMEYSRWEAWKYSRAAGMVASGRVWKIPSVKKKVKKKVPYGLGPLVVEILPMLAVDFPVSLDTSSRGDIVWFGNAIERIEELDPFGVRDRILDGMQAGGETWDLWEKEHVFDKATFRMLREIRGNRAECEAIIDSLLGIPPGRGLA